MSRGMVSFLAGMGTGYIKAKDKALEQERQAKQDAWQEEQRSRQRQEWQEADKLKTDIKDASAVRQAMAGTVTESGGQKLFNADPGQAAQIKSMAESIAELEGGAPVTQAPGYAVTGEMARGHQIGTGAAPGVAALNTPDAESQRVQDVYRRAGLRDKAMTEFTANENYKTAIETRKKTMETEGATKALGLLRSGSPEQAMDAFQSSGSVKLPVGSKFVQLDGIDMHTGKPGKVWGAVGPDGKTIVADVGKYVAQYLGIADQFKFDGEAAKNAQAQANDDREYQLNRDKFNADEKYRGQTLALRSAGGGGGGGGGSAGSGSGGAASFDAYEGFDPKNAQAEATATVDGLIANSGKPVTAQERARLISEQVFALRDAYAGQNANRQRAAVFLSAARSASTPEQVEAVRKQAMGAGFTDQQMAALDPRFAPKVAPAKVEPAKPQGVGLMDSLFGGTKPAQTGYTPEPGSPAARSADARAKAAAAQEAEATKRKQQQDALAQAARNAARAALASKDIAAGAQVQRMPGFSLLTDQEKVAVRGLVFGR